MSISQYKNLFVYIFVISTNWITPLSTMITLIYHYHFKLIRMYQSLYQYLVWHFIFTRCTLYCSFVIDHFFFFDRSFSFLGVEQHRNRRYSFAQFVSLFQMDRTLYIWWWWNTKSLFTITHYKLDTYIHVCVCNGTGWLLLDILMRTLLTIYLFRFEWNGI